MKSGDLVAITWNGKTTPGFVQVVSGDGNALVLYFLDETLGPYRHMMPLHKVGDKYLDLAEGREAIIMHREDFDDS